MKKFIYIVLLLAVLLGVAYVLKNQQPATSKVEEAVVVNEEPASEGDALANEEVVVVDEEPASGEAIATEEVVDENIVEENPEETADEGETVVE